MIRHHHTLIRTYIKFGAGKHGAHHVWEKAKRLFKRRVFDTIFKERGSRIVNLVMFYLDSWICSDNCLLHLAILWVSYQFGRTPPG